MQPSRTHRRLTEVHHYLTLAIAVLLPLSKKLVPPLIILWVLNSFFLFSRKNARMGWLTLLPMALYYVCNVLWLFMSEDRDAALFSLEVKASLLVFPMVWMFLPSLQLRKRLDVMLALVWGCLIFVVASLVKAAVQFQQTGDPNVFYYDDLAWIFHPTYLATYEAFALVVLGRMYIKKVFALGRPWLHHLSAAVLIVHIGLLSSKAGYLCALLAMLLVAIQQLRKKRTLEAVGYMVLGTGLLFATIAVSPAALSRVQETTSAGQELENVLGDEEDTHVVATSSSGARLVAWRSAWEVLLKHPLGVGTGDVVHEIMKVYQRDNEEYAYRKQMNPHNQFLQAGVAFGWIGVVVLVAIFLTGLHLALKRKDFLFLAFLLLLGMNMLFESFLEVQSGVVFFAFFYGFFVRSPLRG